MKKRLRQFVVAVLAGYIAIAGLMFFMQERFTFAPEVAALQAPEGFPSYFTEIHLTTKDSTKLQGLRSEPLIDAPYVVYFGGNAQNLVKFGQLLRETLPDVNLIGFNYRGYGGSEGTSSKKHLMLDVHDIAKWMRDNLPKQPTYSLGLSIGTGPATKFAKLTSAEGLLLIMPYDNLAKVAQGLYPWLPVSPMFTNNILTDRIIEGYKGRVGIIAGEDDWLIKPERSKALANHVENLVAFNVTPGHTHFSLIYSAALQNWLAQTYLKMRSGDN